jgi:nonribosomal peptide synthetase MxcG
VDFVSRAIVHLSRRPDAAGQVCHLLGQPTNWTTLLDWIGEFGYALRRVPFPKWRSALIAVPTTMPHPMTALSPFLPELDAGEDEVAGSLRRFDCANAEGALAAGGVICPPVDAALIARYLSHAVRSGLIEPPGTRVEATAGRPAGGSAHPASAS